MTRDGFHKRLRLTIEFAGFYADDIEGLPSGLTLEEQIEESMQLSSDQVIVVFTGHDGDSLGRVLRSLDGRIVGFALTDMEFLDG